MSRIAQLKPSADTSLPTSPAELDAWFERRFEEEMRKREAAHVPSMALVATKGTLDMAYPPFILASTGAALGWEVSVFFTFYGLLLLKTDIDLRVSPLGNPAMPMKLPYGPKWLRNIDMPMPNAIPSLVPGFESAATAMMTFSRSSRYSWTWAPASNPTAEIRAASSQ